MRHALAIDEQSYGAEHPRLAIDLNNLAQLLQATNRLAEAEPMVRRALAIDKQAYGDEHPYVARDLNNLAGLLKARADGAGKQHDGDRRATLLAEAELLMARVVSIFASFGRQTGHDHAQLQSAIQIYSRLLAEMNLPSDDFQRRIREACGE